MCATLAAVLKPSCLAQEPRICASWLNPAELADWYKAAKIVFDDLLPWTTKAESHYQVSAVSHQSGFNLPLMLHCVLLHSEQEWLQQVKRGSECF